MKNIIVTGANGFIGSSFIKSLVEKKVKVIAVDITFENSRLPKSEYIEKVKIKLDNVSDLTASIPPGDYDAFYHFAWQGVNGYDKANPIIQLRNAEMVINCATVAKIIKCKKFLCAGTIAEKAIESLSYLKQTSGGILYGVAKHMTHMMLEAYCKNIGLDFVWMQFSNIYGPGNMTGNLVSYTIGALAKDNEAIFGPANQPYDFIYIDDLMEAIFRIGESKTNKNFYFIGSGEPRILKEYLFEIGKQFGKRNLIRIGGREDDGILYTLDMFDISALKADIGEYVSVTFAKGIQNVLKIQKLGELNE